MTKRKLKIYRACVQRSSIYNLTVNGPKHKNLHLSLWVSLSPGYLLFMSQNF